MTKKKTNKKDAKTTLILLLVMWLAAWPVAFILNLFGLVFAVPIVTSFVFIFALFLGFYGLFGWIPPLIVYLTNKKK